MTAHNAMLVALNISSFSARRYDRKVSEEVATNHGAVAKKAGNYNKCLVDPEAPVFETLRKAAQDARDYHRDHTLPWAQDGARILPAAEYFEYVSAMDAHRDRFNSAVSDFVSAWPQLKSEARAALNGLYRESDYPSLSQLRRKFEFDVVVLPVPSADDFRVSLGEQEVALVKERITEQVQAAFEEANRDLWRRLHEAVKRVVDNCSDPNKRFTHTMIGNIRELVELLPRLNVTGDAQLEAMRAEVERQLAGESTESLRADTAKRAEVAAKARDIATRMAAFMGGAQ